MTTKTSSATKRTSAAKRTAKRTAKVESKAPEAKAGKAGKAKASIGSYVVGILMSIFIGVVLPLMVRFFLEKLFSKKNRPTTFKASYVTPMGKEEVEFAKEDVEAAGVAALLRRKEDEAAAAFDRAVATAVKKASQGQKAPGLGM